MFSQSARHELLATLVLLLLLLAACGSPPIPIGDTDVASEAGTQAGDSGNSPTVIELEQTRVAEVATAEAAAAADAENSVLATQAGAPEGTVVSAVEPDRGHDSNLSIPFGTKPPLGGVHHPSWQRCQAYDAPIKVEHAVHTLEHGAVWITYQPDIGDAAIEQLSDHTRGEPFVMVSPYPGLESAVIVTAWGLQLAVDSADDVRIQEFVTAFADGPQNPEPGANCTTGVQDTIDG